MKIAALLVTFLTIGQLAEAEQLAYVKHCSSPSHVVNVEVYDIGIVGWVVTDLTTGKNEQFMGYITAGDSQDLQSEFYSTDLGSDLHVNGINSSLTLSRFGTRNIKLQCD